MENYDDLLEAISGLKKRGYERDFNLSTDCIVCAVTDKKIYPDRFKIDNFYRFEGMSSTDDNSIIYALSLDDGTKGILIDAYGVYAQGISTPMGQKLKTAPNPTDFF
jgi:hypothetical protein